jgi:hypothetical protein
VTGGSGSGTSIQVYILAAAVLWGLSFLFWTREKLYQNRCLFPLRTTQRCSFPSLSLMMSTLWTSSARKGRKVAFGRALGPHVLGTLIEDRPGSLKRLLSYPSAPALLLLGQSRGAGPCQPPVLVHCHLICPGEDKGPVKSLCGASWRIYTLSLPLGGQLSDNRAH